MITAYAAAVAMSATKLTLIESAVLGYCRSPSCDYYLYALKGACKYIISLFTCGCVSKLNWKNQQQNIKWSRKIQIQGALIYYILKDTIDNLRVCDKR